MSLIACLGLIASLAGPLAAATPIAGTNFRIDRASFNSGSAVATSGGGSFMTLPQVYGTFAAAYDTGTNFDVNHGRVGALGSAQDDVFVSPFWASQGDIDADPTVGTAGCNPPLFPLVFGINAFDNIPQAVAAVNAAGRVHLMNGLHATEDVQLAKVVSVRGWDESVGTCVGQPGVLGAIVSPNTDYVAGKTVFRVESPQVQLRSLTIDGKNTALTGPTQADHGVLLADVSATWNELRVQDARVQNLAQTGVRIDAPNTSLHLIEQVAFSTIGDSIVTSSTAATAVLLAGASATVTDSTFTDVTSGVLVYGDGPGTLASVLGSGAKPVVAVQDSDFAQVGRGPSSDGLGAVAVTGGATGGIERNSVTDVSYAVRVEAQVASGTLRIADNDFIGPMETAIDIAEVYGAAVSETATVEVAGNDFFGPVEVAAVSARFIGRSRLAPENDGVVLIAGNNVNSLQGTAPGPYGVFLAGVHPVSGLADVTSNTLQGAGSGVAFAGIGVNTADPAAPADHFDSANVLIDANTVSGWEIGLEATSYQVASGATLDVDTGTRAANSWTQNDTGILAVIDATVSVGTDSVPSVVASNAIGIHAGGATALVDVRGATISDNDTAGVLVESGGQVRLENSSVENAALADSVGVLAGVGGGTLDLGGGALASSGGNVLNVLGSNNNWAVALENAGTYRAESNVWRYEGVTYNAPTAIDDLIKDGDLDHLAAGGEAGTIASLDFIPFVRETPAGVVTVDQSVERGTTPGYGVTQFRTANDGLEGVASGGTVNVLPGTYVALRYNADSEFIEPDLVAGQPLSMTATVSGTALIRPSVVGPGTAVSDVLEAGSHTLLRVASSNVAIDDMVFLGNSPALVGGTNVNGVDVQARNGVVVDASAGSFTNIAVSNSIFQNFTGSAVAATRNAPQQTGAVLLVGNSIDNVDGLVVPNFGSIAVRLEAVADATVSTNTLQQVRTGILLEPAGLLPVGVVSYNSVTTATLTGIHARAMVDPAAVAIAFNAIDNAPNGIAVTGISSNPQVDVESNTIAATSLGVAVSGVSNANARVRITDNVIPGTPATRGVGVTQVVGSTATPSVVLDSNAISGHSIGVDIADTLAPFGGGAVSGVALRSNVIEDNLFAVQIASAGLTNVDALVGGPSAASRNFISGSNTGVRVSGASATATIASNAATDPINADEVFFDNAIAVRVSDGASAIVRDNKIDGSTSAGILVTGPGSEALIESNRISGLTNALGIQIGTGARASMGPGIYSTITDPYFGGNVSTGFNRLRNYTGDPTTHFAIENLSGIDQNAQNNDFEIFQADCLTLVELVVEHEPDNSLGFVDFCPLNEDFVSVADWMSLE